MINVFKLWQKHMYTLLVILACSLTFMCVGSSTGWATPSLPVLMSPESPIPVTNDELSWVASILALGGVSASVPYSYLLNKLGRKPMVLIVALFYIAGWSTLIFATSVVHLYVGRFLLGAAVGSSYAVIPIFIGEVVADNIRGAVVTFMALSQSMGTLTTLVVGPLVEFYTLSMICIFFPVAMLLTFLMIPESPYFLLKNGNGKGAMTNLMKFRGASYQDEVSEEFKNIEKFLEDYPKSSFFESLKQVADRNTRWAIIIITVLLIGQQLGGIGAITNYMQMMFDEMDLPVKSFYVVILTEVLADVAVVITSLIMDRVGRKPLYTISALICVLSNVCLGTYYTLKTNGIIGANMSWLPVIVICIMRTGYDFGLNPVPMVVNSEILAFNVKGIVSAYSSFVQGGSLGLVLKLYQIFKDGVGVEYAHWMFAAFALFSMVFVLCFMPETKNKSLAEIQDEFDKKSKRAKCEINSGIISVR